MPYLTPGAAAGVTLCRRLRFDAALADVLTGALEKLTHAYQWEQNTPTDLTPDGAAALALEMLLAYLDGGDICMVGAILPFATEVLPDGILACDGTVYDRADFPDLYAVLDPVYIIDADTFSVPDLRGRAVVGTGQGAGLTDRAIGDTGGEETHTLTEDEMPVHSHTVQDPGLNIIQEGAPDLALSDPGLPTQTGDAGGDEAHENMPPFLALHYGIVAR